MTRHTLFLLKPNLREAGRVFHCPECATVEGVLAYHPEARQALDIRYADFARPRPEVIALLGEANQGCPVLILNSQDTLSSEIPVQIINGKRVVVGPRDICIAFSHLYGTSLPH